MRPLKIAAMVKPGEINFRRENRNKGIWSYPVPEFQWDFYTRSDQVQREVFRSYDLIFIEDSGKPTVVSGKGPPVVHLVFDATLSDRHYLDRLQIARQADLVLLEHDRLERFSTCKRVRRFPYCTNDLIFQPMKKDLDVANHCSSGRDYVAGSRERSELRAYLGEVCRQHGWSYKSGTVGLEIYANNLGRAKIAINLPRTLGNFPHRVFDAMACKACLVTAWIPDIGAGIVPGAHYILFDHKEDLPALLAALLASGDWERIATAGYWRAVESHTWSVRARELRQILAEEFGL